MRIAMLSYHTCPLATLGGKDTGGMNVYVRELTTHLGQMGIQVDVFTRSQDEHVPHVLHDLGYGNRVVHVPAGPETPMPKDELAGYIPVFAQHILEFARSKGLKYDLIHSHYWMSGLAARDLKAQWGVPIVQMFHTLGLMKQRVARRPGEAEGGYRLQGEQEVMRLADRIVAATPAELAQLQWLYQLDTRKVAIIPPGVDLCHFYPIAADEAKEVIGVPPCERLVLFVGRIEPLKGIDTLIQAIVILHQRGFDVCLSVIGGEPGASGDGAEERGSEMERLQAMCRQAGLNDDRTGDGQVAFLGKKAQQTLPYYYSAAEVVVVPSHYESFGMVALEAMACGTPVIASQVGGLAYLIQDGVNGYSIPVDDPHILADRLMDLLTNALLRETLGSQARQSAQEYAWPKIAERVAAVYAQLVR